MNEELSAAEAFARLHPAGVARVLEQGRDIAAGEVLAALEPDVAAGVLAQMAPLSAARALEAAPAKAAQAVVSELGVDVAAALLRRVGDAARRRLVRTDGDARARALSELIAHPPDSAGGLMDPLVLAVTDDLTAGSAVERVRSAAERAMYYVYVVAAGGRLVGVVNQRELMLAAPDDRLVSIMTERPEAIVAHATRDAIAAHPAWQRVHALPVVDRHGLFLGAVRYETVRRLERELGIRAPSADPRITAAALGELYGIGLGGIAAWASSTMRGKAGTRGGRR